MREKGRAGEEGEQERKESRGRGEDGREEQYVDAVFV